MCNFFSFLGFQNGDFFHAADATDSHEVLVRAANVHDSATALLRGHFFRGEFTPPAEPETLGDLATWRLRVDEDCAPDWYDEVKAREWCERQVAQMFVRDARGTLVGGCWILDGEKASAKEIVHGRIAIVANGANLSSANLSRAELSGANLYGANLYGADLSRADLSSANLSSANLSGANLSSANLYGANLSSANLSRADLSSANLSRADLSGANLYGANLYGADLSRAELYGANLYGADLSRAELSGANLDGADLSSAWIVGSRDLPKGWKRLDSGAVVKDDIITDERAKGGK